MGQIYQAIKPKEVIETFGIKNFVETGTGIADSLSYILNVRPDDLNVYTIELMDELHSKLVEKFEGTPNLHLIKGYSHVEMKNILETLSSEPTLFWHDAHFPGADFNINGATYTSESDPTKRIPLESELRVIKESGRDISKDVFVLDDLRVYKDGPYEGGNWDLRQYAGADNINFVYELFDETHVIIESYVAQGFLILFPVDADIEVCKDLIEGVVN
jgi:hypothetical protein